MKSSRNKTSKRLLVLFTGVCLAASGLSAVESSNANGANKPASRPAAAPARPTNTHTPGNRTGATTPSPHSANNRGGNIQPAAVHSAAIRNAAHGSPASTVARTPKPTPAYAAQRQGYKAGNRRSRTWTPRTLTGQQRLARVHLEPERVAEIQQALIREGYFEGDPTGQWDSRTRDAMLRYQTMHGFPPTGLPEAKSLMKLGLGSHPLPPELDHGAVGIASTGVTQTVFSVSPSSPPVPQAAPPVLDGPQPETK